MRYHLRSPDGVDLGTFSEAEICTLIDSGAIMLDALAALVPDTRFVPITQYSVFANAFEARYGLDRPGHTSDSTPVSHAALLEILHQSMEQSSPISMTRPTLDPIEDSAQETLRTISAINDGSSGDLTPVSSPSAELATPIDQPALGDSLPIVRGVPDAPTEVDGRTAPPTGGLSAVIPSAPTLTDAPEYELTQATSPRSEEPSIPEPVVLTRAADPRALEGPSSPPARAPTNARLFEVSVGLGVWVVMFALLSVASHRFGLGADEGRLTPGSLLFWARTLLLIGAGGALIWAFPGDPVISRRDFEVSRVAALAAIGVGVLAGASFPAGRPTSPLFVALLMVSLTAIAEEVFFRAYLGRVLEAAFPRPLVSVGLAAALYGVYASTHAAVWVDRTPTAIVLRILLLAVGAGVPYALLHHWTKSLIPPLLCHWVLNVAVVTGSVLR